MISEYVQAALNETKYDWMEEEGEYFAAPPSIPGAWGTGKTVEAARGELREVIEDMILVSARLRTKMPEVGAVTGTARRCRVEFRSAGDQAGIAPGANQAAPASRFRRSSSRYEA